jgi:predicted lactoylglutathione lyase
MSKMIFVNLPVRDLAASTAFYVALGGEVNPQFSGEQSTSLMFSDSIGVMLLTHDHYRQFTQRPIGDARRESQAMIALSVDSRDAVGCDAAAGRCRGRPRRPQPGAGSWLPVQPPRRGSGRQCLGDHVDGRRRARPDAPDGVIA